MTGPLAVASPTAIAWKGNPMVRPVLFALALAGILGPLSRPVMAGSPYYGPADRGDARPDPAASGVPGIPNLQGCIKRCERDLNPCDPPVYKQADGRCNYLN